MSNDDESARVRFPVSGRLDLRAMSSAVRSQGWTVGPKTPQTPQSNDVVDLAEVISPIRQGWRLILGCAALVAAVCLGVTLVARMEFKATGSLYLGELQGKGNMQTALPDQLDFLAGLNGEVGTEMEILKSKDLLKRAAMESGLNVTIYPLGWQPPRYWSWRLNHRDLDQLDTGYRKVVSTNAILPTGTSKPRSFKLTFLANGNYDLSGDGLPGVRGVLGKPLVTGQLVITLNRGEEGPPAAGESYTMIVHPVSQVVDSVAKALTVAVPKSAANDTVKIVTLDFSDRSPRLAAAFVTRLMSDYIERHQSWKSEEATATERFVTSQVQSMKDSLDEAERQLAEYKKNSRVMVLGDEAKGMIDQISKFEEQRVSARLQAAAFGQIQRGIAKRGAVLEQYLVGEADDPVLVSLSNNLASAQQELHQAQERFTDDSPNVREQKARVDTQLQTVKSYVQSRHLRAQQQLGALNGMIAEFGDKLKTVPRAELELAQLTRNKEVFSKMYSFLLERQQQAAVTKASTISRNHVLDAPEIPSREDSPSLAVRIFAGLFFGLFSGVLIVLIRRMFTGTFQTDRELHKRLSDIPVLAIIPNRRMRNNRVADVFDTNPSSFSEAFRLLRTNLYYSESTGAEKVILITSPCPGDGKTLCTLSLASALAADGKRVLVIEGDMHRPMHHILLNQSQDPGLSSLLKRNDIIRSVTTPSGTIDTVVAGSIPSNPAELLSSAQFGALVDYAKKTYDFVLIDSPPFPLVSDALIMARHSDRVITVVRPRNTRRRVAEEHVGRFSVSSAQYGVVINDIEDLSIYGTYRHGYHQQADEVRRRQENIGSSGHPSETAADTLQKAGD